MPTDGLDRAPAGFSAGNASVRLNRFGKTPIYLGVYGRWTHYGDHDFDDAYAGAEAGPEFQLAGGRLRTTATSLMRWYGRRPLVESYGARLEFDKLVGDQWNVNGALLVRHNAYARRRDVDGWEGEAQSLSVGHSALRHSVSLRRALGAAGRRTRVRPSGERELELES